MRSVRLSSAQSSGADDDMRRSKPAVVSNALPLRHPRCWCARVIAAQLALADRHEQCDRECVTGDQAQDRKSTTSELQSLMRTSYAAFCLKKKKLTTIIN